MVHLNKEDEELHHLSSALYKSLFKLMNVLIAWFLRGSVAREVRILVNHSRFSDELKTRLADVKLAAQRFASHAVVIASKERQNISQQNHSIMHLQYQNMHFGSLRQQEIVGKLGEIESQVKKVNHRLAEIDRFTRINLLEILEPFLDTTQDAMEERRRLILQRQVSASAPLRPRATTDEILNRYSYDGSFMLTDSRNTLRSQRRPGSNVDEHRVQTFLSHPRVRAFLMLDESALLLLNANSTSASLDMSVASAMLYKQLHGIWAVTETKARMIPLVFFCGQHREWGDAYGWPLALALSLLLKLVDKFGDYGADTLGAVFDDFAPDDVGSIVVAFGKLIAVLPQTLIVTLIVDGLRCFEHPPERQRGMVQVIEGLTSTYDAGSRARLKFLFTNSTRVAFVEHLFSRNAGEVLDMPRDPRPSGRW